MIPDNRRILLLLLVATALVWLLHLPLVWWVEGEFTDGVLQTLYFQPVTYVCVQTTEPARYVPPLYPALLHLAQRLGLDGLMAGRLISLTAYALTGLVLALTAGWLGQRWKFSSTAQHTLMGLTWLFWSLSPLANQWSLHCMSDMLFTLFVTGTLACTLKASTEKENWERTWLIGNLWAVSATWTRYQGFILLGLLLVVWIYKNKSKPPEATHNRYTYLIPISALLLWGGTLVLLGSGTRIHQGQFSQRAVYPWIVYWDFLETALLYLPYALTPPLFILLIIGLVRLSQSGQLTRSWILAGILAGFLGLLIHTWFISFQFRYGLPLLPWICLISAAGCLYLNTPAIRILAILSILWMILLSVALFRYQPGTFSELNRIAREIHAQTTPDQTLYANEWYNEKYRNIKLSAWTGRKVEWLDESKIPHLKQGDILVDSNVYPIPPPLLSKIREDWKLLTIAEEVQTRIPIFPGEIIIQRAGDPPGGIGFASTSQPELMAYRYIPQTYSAVAYQINSKK